VDVAFLGADGPVGEPFSARIGQTWEWWPAPNKLGDNRLDPGEFRTWPVAIPAGAQQAQVTASSHRMTPETAQHHDLADYPLSVVTAELTVLRP